MIVVDDIVNVTLSGGSILIGVTVKDVPGNNLIYWTFEDATGSTWVIGPSLTAIEKKP